MRRAGFVALLGLWLSPAVGVAGSAAKLAAKAFCPGPSPDPCSLAQVQAGQDFGVLVSVLDASGGPTTFSGTVSVISSDPLATLPPPYTFGSSDLNGLHLFPGLVLRTVGAQTVTVTDTADGLSPGTVHLTVTSAAGTRSDALLVLGAGNAKPWVTELVFSNPTSEVAGPFIIGGGGQDTQSVCPPLTGCNNQASALVPPNGTVVTGCPDGFPVMYIRQGAVGGVPLVRARIFNSTQPVQGADLPVFHLATILELNPAVLVFPIRPQAVRTNLLLANVKNPAPFRGGEVTVKIELFAPDGSLLVTGLVTITAVDQLYLVDIGQFFQVANPSSGQVRVTRVGGDGVFWGILPSLNADGTISITLGQVL